MKNTPKMKSYNDFKGANMIRGMQLITGGNLRQEVFESL